MSNIDEETFDIDHCIDVISEGLEESIDNDFYIHNFSMQNLMVSFHKITVDSTEVFSAVYPVLYTVKIVSHYDMDSIFLFHRSFPTLSEAVMKVYNLVDDDGNIKFFSKLTSLIFTTKEELLNFEKRYLVAMFISRKSIDSCCVCFEKAVRKTPKCGHVLCYCCFVKVSDCPLCRRDLEKFDVYSPAEYNLGEFVYEN
jgi:hypothetical protein